MYQHICVQITKMYICFQCNKENTINSVLGKLPPGWFPPDNSHSENSHLGKFPRRITPTWKIPTQKIPTHKSPTWVTPIQKIPSNITQYSNNIQTTKFPPIMFAIKIIPMCHFPTDDDVKLVYTNAHKCKAYKLLRLITERKGNISPTSLNR